MFLEEERLQIVRDAILVAFEATRAKARRAAAATLSQSETAAVERFDAAMGRLDQLQHGDFEGILEAMAGLPVIIRLIDPPLHEFLPNYEELLRAVTAEDAGTPTTIPGSPRSARCSPAVESLREANPMLGLRGVPPRADASPRSSQMQVRAILEAAIASQRAGVDVASRDHDPAGRPRERAEA